MMMKSMTPPLSLGLKVKKMMTTKTNVGTCTLSHTFLHLCLLLLLLPILLQCLQQMEFAICPCPTLGLGYEISLSVVSHSAFLLMFFSRKAFVKLLYGIALNTSFKPIDKEINKGIGVVLVNSQSCSDFLI